MMLNEYGKYLLTKVENHKLPLEDAEQVVFNLLRYELNDNMYSALVSLLLSIGEPAFRRSRVLSLVNLGTEKSMLDAGKYLRTTHTMRRGKTIGKLVKLRKWQSQLFLLPSIVPKEAQNDRCDTQPT